MTKTIPNSVLERIVSIKKAIIRLEREIKWWGRKKKITYIGLSLTCFLFMIYNLLFSFVLVELFVFKNVYKYRICKRKINYNTIVDSLFYKILY